MFLFMGFMRVMLVVNLKGFAQLVKKKKEGVFVCGSMRT